MYQQHDSFSFTFLSLISSSLYCYCAISLPGMHAQEGETANSTLENAAQSRFVSVKNISYRFNV
jgi:hypothetical protein